MSGASFYDVSLARMPAPQVLKTVDYELAFNQLKALLNAQTPALLDADHIPVIDVAELIQTDKGDFWLIPADPNKGRYDLRLPLDPLPRALMAKTYIDMLLIQQFNESIKAVMPAFATGADLDHLALRYKTVRLLLEGDVGDDDAVYESDDALRKRMLLNPEGNSNGGATGWYHYHALTADSLVKDVLVISPAPCYITITILSHEGDGTASPELLSTVDTALHSQYTRALGDLITVQSAEVISYTLEASISYYTNAPRDLILANINTAFAAFRQQAERMGHAVPLSAVQAALHQSGVYQVVITSVLPVISATQASFCSDLILTDLGDVDV